MERLPDEKVKVKISVCQKCKGHIRVAVKHLMDSKTEKDFYKEAQKYDLLIEEQDLVSFRKANVNFCSCKT